MGRLKFLLIPVILIFLIIGQGCEGKGPELPKEPKLPTEKKFEPFSFAIITDLHVGYDFSDYGSEGYKDYDLETGQPIGKEGDFNFVTDRLVATVNWLNENYEKRKIKFLVILGDISDTAEMSEFFRAKKILDDLEIPYIPIMGNHDVWSTVAKPCTPPGRSELIPPILLGEIKFCLGKEDEIPCFLVKKDGQEYFEKIFWNKAHNQGNIEKIKNLFSSSWQRQEEIGEFAGSPYYQNYAFSYQGINFLVLDYARRNTNCWASLAEPFSETKDWLKENLEKHQGEIVITFSHIPHKVRCGTLKFCGFLNPEDADNLAELASKNNVSALNFAGHIHNWENVNEVFGKDTKAPVIVTKGLVGKTGEKKEKEDANFLRIVRVRGSEIKDIDYTNKPLRIKDLDSAGIVTIKTTPTTKPPSPITPIIPEEPERKPIGDITGTYVNPEDRRGYLELREDGSFFYRPEFFFQWPIEGEWKAKGNEIILTYYFLGLEQKAKGKIKGNTITVIDQDNQVWAENWIKEEILKIGGELSLSVGARYLVEVLDHHLIEPGKNPRLYIEYQNISEEPLEVRIDIHWRDSQGLFIKDGGQKDTRGPIASGKIEKLIYPLKPGLFPEEVANYHLSIYASEWGRPYPSRPEVGPEIEPEEIYSE